MGDPAGELLLLVEVGVLITKLFLRNILQMVLFEYIVGDAVKCLSPRHPVLFPNTLPKESSSCDASD